MNGLLLVLSAKVLCYWVDRLTFTQYAGSYGISCNFPAKEHRNFKCCFLLYLKIYFLCVCGKRRKNDSRLIIQSFLLIFAIISLGLLLPSYSAITSYKWETSMGYPNKVQHINQLSLDMLHQSFWLVLYFDSYCICVLSDNICLTLT